MIYLAVSLFVALLAGFTAHHLARQKSRAVQPWVLASALFLLPLLVLVILPRKAPVKPVSP